MTFQKAEEIIALMCLDTNRPLTPDERDALQLSEILIASAALLEKQYQLLLAGGTLEAS